MIDKELLLTTGTYFNMISDGRKRFDVRKGNKDIKKDDIILFKEADMFGNILYGRILVHVNLVLKTKTFPKYFGLEDINITIFQFTVLSIYTEPNETKKDFLKRRRD